MFCLCEKTKAHWAIINFASSLNAHQILVKLLLVPDPDLDA